MIILLFILLICISGIGGKSFPLIICLFKVDKYREEKEMEPGHATDERYLLELIDLDTLPVSIAKL